MIVFETLPEVLEGEPRVRQRLGANEPLPTHRHPAIPRGNDLAATANDVLPLGSVAVRKKENNFGKLKGPHPRKADLSLTMPRTLPARNSH